MVTNTRPRRLPRHLGSAALYLKPDGTWMKAPNGQPSKLNAEQWVAVRTKRFKEWFGD
jgi:hypothetical protein